MQIETDPGGRYDLHAYHRGIDGGPRWELSVEITCDGCDSHDVSVIEDNTLIVLACHECSNWWLEDYAGLLHVDRDTGEIRRTTWTVPFTFDGRPNRY